MGDTVIEIEELNLPLIDKTIYDIKAYVVFDREEEKLWYLSSVIWNGDILEWNEVRQLDSADLSRMIWDHVIYYIYDEVTEKAEDHFLDEVHDY